MNGIHLNGLSLDAVGDLKELIIASKLINAQLFTQQSEYWIRHGVAIAFLQLFPI